MSKLTPGLVLMLLVNVILGSTGQVFLKYGIRRLSFHAGQPFVASLVDAFKGIFTPYVFGGACIYFLSFILWIRILKQVPLSFAYPTISLGYIVVVVLSMLIFHEKVSGVMASGLFLIAAGVAVLGIGYAAVK